MNHREFERRFARCRYHRSLSNAGQRQRLWARAGKRRVDLALGELAVLYGEASPGQRAEIRRSLAGLDTWDLVLYVRRVALPIHSPTDVDWLKKGLAVASIETGQFDFRDTIVSLVLLRYAAEKAGIDARQHFDETIAISDKAVVSSLENARDHRPGDMRDIIYQFGPREWEQPSRSLLHQHGRCKGK